jgi:hypothetical protein
MTYSTDDDASFDLRRSACLCDVGASGYLLEIAIAAHDLETLSFARHDAIIGGEVHL